VLAARDEAVQVQRLADEAARHVGRIDTWVNDVGVAVYGALERTPIEEMRRAIEVDLLGTMHGAKAALSTSASPGVRCLHRRRAPCRCWPPTARPSMA